jgi:hypothetical protein
MGAYISSVGNLSSAILNGSSTYHGEYNSTWANGWVTNKRHHNNHRMGIQDFTVFTTQLKLYQGVPVIKFGPYNAWALSGLYFSRPLFGLTYKATCTETRYSVAKCTIFLLMMFHCVGSVFQVRKWYQIRRFRFIMMILYKLLRFDTYKAHSVK